MKVLIYGGGAVGLGIASCLLESQAEIDIIAREKTVAALRTDGLSRTGIFGNYHAGPAEFSCYKSLDGIGAKVYDYILVCAKSFDSSDAAKELSKNKQLFGEETKIVLFQNGWGNAEIFSSYFRKAQIYNARVITGFRRLKASVVEITVHADSIHIGSLYGGDLASTEKLCEAISAGGIPCEETESIEKDLWAKMLYNCALNPLGAIVGVPYGDLAANGFTRNLMDAIVEETFGIIKAAGYQTHWQSAKDFLEVFYRKLVPDTAEHKSSTLQDILAKKKTEIEALNGAVIKLAKKYCIDVPCNIVVYNIVKFLEAANS